MKANRDAERDLPGWPVRLRMRGLDLFPFALVVGLWWVLTQSRMINPVFLPSPEATLRTFLSLLNVSFFRENFAPSFLRVGGAFLLSAAIAVPLGVLSATVSKVRRMVLPLCSFSRYLPVPALVPLCILWFGIDNAQKIGVITIGSVFQLLMLVAADTSAVPVELVETSRTLGLSPSAVTWRVVLPAAMPAIWDDLRVCAGWAWSYLILAELVAGNRGIGYFIVQAQRYLDTERVFAGVLLVGLLGLVTDQLFHLSARRFFPWV
jgi:NitT/TauT family transport system permease protein